MHRAFAGCASLLLMAALGCDAPPSVSVDLTELYGLAEPLSETESIDFGTREARPHLVEGWRGDERTSSGRTFVWGRDERSVLRLVAGEPRDLELRFRCWPLAYEGATAQEVGLSLNGTPLARIQLAAAPRWYSVPLPGALLSAGENLLEMRYAHAARPREVVPGARDKRKLSVAWEELRLVGARSYGLPEVDADPAGPSLRLPFRASVDYYVMIPKGGELRFASVEGWAEGAVPTGRLEVELRGAEGEGSAVYSLAPRSGGPRTVELPAVRGGPARVSLRAALEGPAPEAPAGLVLARPELRIPAATEPAERVGGSTPSEASRPNIIVYLIDTLRRDHLGVYGYPRDVSPHIDAFAQDATVFDAAVAQSPWTRPSVASIFTGVHPKTHGVTRPKSALSERLPVLPELLHQAGYRTWGVVTNGNVSRGFGFARGFDRFLFLRQGLPSELHAQSDAVNEVAFRWLAEAGKERPFFLYLHTTDPHVPYRPRSPWRERFAAGVSDPSLGSILGMTALGRGADLSPGQRHALMSLYDAEIAFNDESFGLLLEKMRELDLYDSSLIALLSDHGEAFQEHGTWGHGTTLYTEELAVPLVIKFPHGHGRGRVVGELVRHVDLLPTVLEWIGLDAPAHLEGRSLFAQLGDGTAPPPAAAVSHLGRRVGHWESAMQSGHKLVRTRTRDGRQERIRMFDLDVDPHELNDVAAERPVWRGYLISQLRRFADVDEDAPEAEIDPELRERLQALGYL